MSSKSIERKRTFQSDLPKKPISHEDSLKCEIRLEIFTAINNPTNRKDEYSEGEKHIYKLRLSEAPSADLTVGLSIRHDKGTKRQVILNKTELSFSMSNWETLQEVNLHTINDKIVHPNPLDKSFFTFTASSPGRCKERVHKFSVQENSQRPHAIYIKPSSMRKGEYREIIVWAEVRPLGPVTVKPICVKNDGCDKLVFKPSSVMINPEDFRTQKIIQVSFKEGSFGEESVAMSFTGGGYGSNFKVTTFRLIEDPKVTLNLNPNPIDEKGDSTTVTATLNKPSNKETTVTISAMPGLNATDDDYTLSYNKILTIQ